MAKVNTAYQVGMKEALVKLGLLDAPSKRLYYPSIPRISPMVGDAAIGEYDPLEAMKRMGRIDEGFMPMDRNMKSNGDTNDILDIPVAEGGNP